jgi:hypothetical protein
MKFVTYDARYDIFWSDGTVISPWEYRIPVCLARPDRWWVGYE